MFRLSREPHTYSELDLDTWKRLREIRYVEIPVLAEVMSRDDGFRLIHLGKESGIKGRHYRYLKGGTEFEFTADRAHWGGTVTDTYSVVLGFRRGWSVGDRVWPLPRAAVEEIAADIDAALRAWPTLAGQAEVPIGVVRVLIHVSVAVHGASPGSPGDDARYELRFGHPVALRRVPPSPRWKLRVVTQRRRDKWLGTEAVRECQILVSDDGVELIRNPTLRGPQNDGPDSCDYVDDDVTFEFSAERRLSTTLVTDTWEVRLNPPRSNGLSPELRDRLGPARCAGIVGNIEEALYAWPLGKGYTEEIPVNRVVFLDADIGQIGDRAVT
jgi:hypothetical protein